MGNVEYTMVHPYIRVLFNWKKKDQKIFCELIWSYSQDILLSDKKEDEECFYYMLSLRIKKKYMAVHTFFLFYFKETKNSKS